MCHTCRRRGWVHSAISCLVGKLWHHTWREYYNPASIRCLRRLFLGTLSPLSCSPLAKFMSTVPDPWYICTCWIKNSSCCTSFFSRFRSFKKPKPRSFQTGMKFGRNCSSSKFAPIDQLRLWRHTFKMTAMTSAHRRLLHMQQRPPAAR